MLVMGWNEIDWASEEPIVIKPTIFLDSSERGNSKTYYYLRLCRYHGIPLVVHNHEYKKQLVKQYMHLWQGLVWKDPIPAINVIDNLDSRRDASRRKFICDNMQVQMNLNYRNLNWYTDDELREIILSDMAMGKGWRYE